MHILCIAIRYNKAKSLKITKVSHLLCFFYETRASALFLGLADVRTCPIMQEQMNVTMALNSI